MDATITLINELLNDILEQELDMLADTLDGIALLTVVESPIAQIKETLRNSGQRFLLGTNYHHDLIGDRRKRDTWVRCAIATARRFLS